MLGFDWLQPHLQRSSLSEKLAHLDNSTSFLSFHEVCVHSEFVRHVRVHPSDIDDVQEVVHWRLLHEAITHRVVNLLEIWMVIKPQLDEQGDQRVVRGN